MKMAVKIIIVGILIMMWCVSWGKTDLAIAQEQSDVLQIGRYQFICKPGCSWGYRVDTATGEIWEITLKGVKQYLPPISPVPLGVGRFYVTLMFEGLNPYPRFIIDTATGAVCEITFEGVKQYWPPVNPALSEVGRFSFGPRLDRPYFRVDTATGEVWSIGGGLRQYWPPASSVPLSVGRFYVIFEGGPPCFRVDTATGEIWWPGSNSDGSRFNLVPFAPPVTPAEGF